MKTRVLFVCTDNIGRSVVAEYCLKDFLDKNNIENWEVASAGINANSNITGFSMAHFEKMREIGIDVSQHERRQIDETIIKNTNLIIVFDKTQQDYILDTFRTKCLLFNEICLNQNKDLKISEFPGHDKDQRMIQAFDYICEAIPTVFEKINNF